jgi:HEAT repeat protein
MLNTRIIIDRPAKYVWQYFKDKNNWNTWHTELPLQQVDPGWIAGAKLRTKSGSGDTIESIVEGVEVVISGFMGKTCYRFTKQGEEATCVEIEETLNNESSLKDGGKAFIIRNEISLSALKYCLEKSDQAQDATAREVPAELDKIITHLKDNDSFIRSTAARALARIGDPRAIGPMVEALKTDSDMIVKHTIGEALKDFGSPAMEPLLGLLKLKGYQNEDAAKVAAIMLGKMGPEVLEPLLSMLGSRCPEEREYAALALGWLGNQRAVEPLMALLSQVKDDPMWHLSAKATEQVVVALAKIGDLRAANAIIAAAALPVFTSYDGRELLKGALQELAQKAAALAKQGNRDDITRILSDLQTGDLPTKMNSMARAGALWVRNEPRALEPFLVALQDKDQVFRMSILVLLGKQSKTTLREVINASPKSGEFHNILVKLAEGESIEAQDAKRVLAIIEV